MRNPTTMELFLLLITVVSSVVASTDKSCTKLATYNPALLHRVGEYKNREPLIAKKLAENYADVYCLDEVWLESDMERIITQIGEKYPNHFSQIHYKQGRLRKSKGSSWWHTPDAPCSAKDLFAGIPAVGACAKWNGCFDVYKSNGSAKGANCLTTKCPDTIKNYLNPECFECVILMLSGFSGVKEACGPDFGEKRNRLNPSGLVMLSKKPMTNVKYIKFWPKHKQTIERGYIEAEIQGIGKVICTHLSSTYDDYVEYDMNFASFEVQNAAEIKKLINQYGDVDHILIGDLNTGPEVNNKNVKEKNLTGESQQNYGLLIESGYKAPYFVQDGRCTNCKDNPLTNGKVNKVIDHILVRGNHVTISDFRRILDETRPVLSDHFGVQATVCPADQSQDQTQVKTQTLEQTLDQIQKN